MPIQKTHRARKALKHLLFFGLGISAAYLLATSGIIHNFLESTRELTFLAAFISGVLFTSAFTTIPSIASLFILGEHNNPLLISVIASLGSVVGDLILLKVFKKEISVSEDGFLSSQRKKELAKFLRIPIVSHLTILVAMLVIASPLPDELGIGLLGLVNFKQENFLWLSLVANFLGILAITTTAHYSHL